MLHYLTKKWNKRYLLLIIAVICLLLFFFGSSQNIPNAKFFRPLGYLCLGFSGMLQLMTN